MQKLSKDQVIKIMSQYGNDPQQLIAILLDIQEASGNNCVERQWAELASDILKVPLSKIHDVLTFYAMFSEDPRGEYVIEICRSTPCFFNRMTSRENENVSKPGTSNEPIQAKLPGTEQIVQWFEDAAGIKIGETTTDGKVSLFYTNCVGACDIGPVAKIGDEVYGNLTAEKVKTLVKCCRDGNKQELNSLCQS